MSTEREKRQVRIVNSKTGEVRLSEPMPVHSSNQPNADTVPATATTRQQEIPDAKATAPMSQAFAVAELTSESAAANAEEEDAGAEKAPKASKSAKPKFEIETFEQFIEYAYKRRGQRALLEFKVQQAIAMQPRLDEAAVGRLLGLVNADALLAVPRQILLASRDVDGLPALRGALVEFVFMVMMRHPAFASEGVQATARNLPGAMTSADALGVVAAYTPTEEEGAEPLKPSELKELRRNATHLLATWFALHRGLGLEEVSNLLMHVLWEPAARDLTDDTTRLRALTEVEDPAGVGVATQYCRQREAEARRQEVQVRREANKLRDRVAELSGQLEQAQAQLDECTEQLNALRTSSAQEAARLREEHRAGRMHQGHEFESLRGRMVQRLEESIETLEVGLNALRNPTPRVSVMDQRAEVVLDVLRAELNNLSEE